MPRPTVWSRGAGAPAPTEASLHEAALTHLARFAATRAGVTAVLTRRVERWRRGAATTDPEAANEAAVSAFAAIASVIGRLVASGLLDDAAFAAARTASLRRAGRSRRAVGAYLAARGVGAEDLASMLPDDHELACAAVTARRRRIGPFRRGPLDVDGTRREVATMARAGFAQNVARTALALELEAAEALIARLRRG